jgi:hypothetical protein
MSRQASIEPQQSTTKNELLVYEEARIHQDQQGQDPFCFPVRPPTRKLWQNFRFNKKSWNNQGIKE